MMCHSLIRCCKSKALQLILVVGTLIFDSRGSLIFTEPNLSHNNVHFFNHNFDIRELEVLRMKMLT
jgi:hypothetical protein